jgi:hypothetical protein
MTCYISKIQDISRHLLAPLLDVLGAAREHWWMNQGYKNLDGDAKSQKMIALLGTLSTPPSISNQ